MFSRYKTCTKCKKLQLTLEFSKDKNKKDGLCCHCKTCSKKYGIKWRYKNREKLKISKHEYDIKNRDKIAEYKRKRYAKDTCNKLSRLLRKRVYTFTKGVNKSKSTMELLGCDIDHLKIYLQFTAYANDYLDFDIENYSGKEYHIDHIVPCASFDLSYPEQQKQCFHYSNLQILEAKENISKGAGYDN